MKKICNKKVIMLAIGLMLILSTFVVGIGSVSAQGDGWDDTEEIEAPGVWNGELNVDNEEDYWKFELEESQIVTINFTAEVDANLRLELYEPTDLGRDQAFRLESADGVTDSDDYMIANGTATDYWFIKVYENFGDYGSYSFEIDITYQNDAGSGGDVASTFDEAYEIEEGGYEGILGDMDEKDMYKINLEESQVVNIDFTAEGDADLRLELYEPTNLGRDQAFRLESADGIMDSDDYAIANGTSSDYWFLEVYEHFGTLGPYSFEISITYQNDAGSGGDAASAGPGPSLPEYPTPISPGEWTGYMNAPGDIRDIYGMDVPGGSTITINVDPPNTMTVDQWLRNDEGTDLDVDYDNVAGDESEVSWVASSDEFVYIWLKCQDGKGTYSMDIELTGLEEPDSVTLYDPEEEDITSSSVKLSWSQSEIDDFDKYEIYVSESSGSLGTRVETVSHKTTTATTIENLDSDTMYYFTVRVVNTVGVHEDSNQVSATTSESEDDDDPIFDEDDDLPEFVEDWFERGMMCLALGVIIVVVIVIIIIVVIIKLVKKDDKGGEQPPRQEYQQPPPPAQSPEPSEMQYQEPVPPEETGGDISPGERITEEEEF